MPVFTLIFCGDSGVVSSAIDTRICVSLVRRSIVALRSVIVFTCNV